MTAGGWRRDKKNPAFKAEEGGSRTHRVCATHPNEFEARAGHRVPILFRCGV